MNDIITVTAEFEKWNTNTGRTEKTYTLQYAIPVTEYQRILDSFNFEDELARYIPVQVPGPHVRSYTHERRIVSAVDDAGHGWPTKQSPKGEAKMTEIVAAAAAVEFDD